MWDATGILFVSVAVAQKTCLSVSVSAESRTEVFDGSVGFFKYDLMLGTFADTFLLCLSLFIWLSNARLPILCNANDRWQKQQRTLSGSFNSFTQDENCGFMISSNHSWLKTQDIRKYFGILLLNLKDIKKHTHTNSHWGRNVKERILSQLNVQTRHKFTF